MGKVIVPAVALVLVAVCLAGSAGFAAQEPYAPVIDPADFVSVIDNPFFPLIPGTTFVYEGRTRDGFERIETVVTHDTKVILGVTTTVVSDNAFLNGELVEATFDWYAQDMDGNVWYFGEDTTSFENGVPVSTEGSWEAGVNGALPGIIMLADPQPGDVYRQEFAEGVAEDMARVLGLHRPVSVPFGFFEDPLVTKEWSPLEPGQIEHKYYAEGVGLILEVGLHGGQGRIALVDVITE